MEDNYPIPFSQWENQYRYDYVKVMKDNPSEEVAGVRNYSIYIAGMDQEYITTSSSCRLATAEFMNRCLTPACEVLSVSEELDPREGRIITLWLRQRRGAPAYQHLGKYRKGPVRPIRGESF